MPARKKAAAKKAPAKKAASKATQRRRNELQPKVRAAGEEVFDPDSLNDDYLLCRTLGHMWRPYSGKEVVEWGYGTPVGFKCSRCGMVRHEVWDALGQVDHRGYDQPPGYSHPKTARSEYRQAILNRKIETVVAAARAARPRTARSKKKS